MDLESKAFDLVYGQLAYPGTVSKADLRQICQGHARSVIGFLVATLVSQEKKRTIALNLSAHRRTHAHSASNPRNDSAKLEKISALERKLANVKREFRTKAFKRDVTAAHARNVAGEIQRFREQTEAFATRESPLLSPKPGNSEEIGARIPQAIERLEYIAAEAGKGSVPSGDAALMVLTGAELVESMPEVFRRLIDMCEGEKSAVGEKSNGMNLEEEAKKQGFVYLKEGKKGMLQRTDALSLISKLRKQVEALRNHEWQQFIEVEEVLARAKDLRKTFKKVQQAKVSLTSSSSSLSEYLRLELDLQSKLAEMKSLEKGVEALGNTRESLQARLELLRTQPTRGLKSASERDALLQRYSSLMDSNTSFRRNLPKLKVRIKDFVLKHFAPMSQSIPSLFDALQDSVVQETKAVAPFWPAMLRSSSGMTDVDIASTEAFRDKIEDWKLQRVLQAVDLPCYTPTPVLLAALQPCEACEPQTDVRTVETQIAEIHRKEVQAEGPLGLERLKEVEKELKKEETAVRELSDRVIPEWQVQPGQFLVPWVTDKDGLSIKDTLDLWRAHTLPSY